MKNEEKVIKELKNERGTLEEKRNKLENFLYNNQEMNVFQKELLIEQLMIMECYINVLSRRIKNLLER